MLAKDEAWGRPEQRTAGSRKNRLAPGSIEVPPIEVPPPKPPTCPPVQVEGVVAAGADRAGLAGSVIRDGCAGRARCATRAGRAGLATFAGRPAALDGRRPEPGGSALPGRRVLRRDGTAALGGLAPVRRPEPGGSMQLMPFAQVATCAAALW